MSGSSPLRDVLALARPFTLLAPSVGALAHAGAAHFATGTALSVQRIGLGLASALLATASSNAWNQVFDVEIDRVNRPTRPVPAGRMTEARALWLGHAGAALALVCGFAASPVFGACVAAGVLASWIYSAPPLRMKRRTWGALLTISVPRGGLVPIAGWALVVDPRSYGDPWWWAAASFSFVLGAAATKDFADMEGDAAHGCRTLPVVWGPERAARWVAPFLVAPFGLVIALLVADRIHADLAAALGIYGVLACLGAYTAWQLLRDPKSLATSGRQHPAWRGMYLLLLGLHIGACALYRFGVHS